MPTYDYECRNCRHAFEEFQSITANPLRKCPSCGKRSLERLIGAGAGVIFRGSGFYTTDYRSKEYKEKAKADKPTPSGDAKKSGAKSNGKSESSS
ncbi:MAG: FmdB family zinc ribbon protein [Planctomycetota bacterium]|jgi:putative FmdB family regulatory protein